MDNELRKNFLNVGFLKDLADMIFLNMSVKEKTKQFYTIRYPKINISRDMIIKYNSKTYTIEYLNDIDEKHIELEIQAKMVKK